MFQSINAHSITQWQVMAIYEKSTQAIWSTIAHINKEFFLLFYYQFHRATRELN
jgi:hypothetical protein